MNKCLFASFNLKPAPPEIELLMPYQITTLAIVFTAGSMAPSLPALAQDHSDHNHAEHAAQPVVQLAPYSLDTCPVSGQELGSMGDPIINVYNGREVRFCCDGCPEQFEADQDTFFEKIDAVMVADQMPFYPLDTCVVSGEPLTEDGEDVAINMVSNNRLVRLCCKMCKADFKADPATYLAKLDEAVIAAQRERYPLDRCVISDEDMTGLAEEDVVEVIVANRLFRLCCPPCEPDVLANPVRAIQALDAAWAQTPGGMPAFASMSDHAGMHDEHAEMPHNEGKSDGHDHDHDHDHESH